MILSQSLVTFVFPDFVHPWIQVLCFASCHVKHCCSAVQWLAQPFLVIGILSVYMFFSLSMSVYVPNGLYLFVYHIYRIYLLSVICLPIYLGIFYVN